MVGVFFGERVLVVRKSDHHPDGWCYLFRGLERLRGAEEGGAGVKVTGWCGGASWGGRYGLCGLGNGLMFEKRLRSVGAFAWGGVELEFRGGALLLVEKGSGCPT